MFILFLLFVLLPIIEIMLIVEVSGNIGGLNTLGIVLITAILGAYFVKREGIATLNSVQVKAANGEMPGVELLEGIMLLVAGVLLVTPGFITDVLGLLFTLPFSRKYIASALMRHLQHKQASGQNAFYFNFHQHSRHSSSTNDGADQGATFEGEYQDKTDVNEKNRLE